MQYKNILLLSAGRRVSLARALDQVARANGARCITADKVPELSAACQDSGLLVTLPHVLSSDYPEALLSICRRHDIKLVVPTIDTELPVLAALRDEFARDGINIAVCSSALVDVARDKRKTAAHFADYGITSPRVFSNDSPQYPAIAKPYDGSLSRDIYILRSEKDYRIAIDKVPNLMIAAYLEPQLHEEFTCDAYYNRDCRLECVVPRLRIEVRGGEVAKGRTVRNNIVELFESKLQHIEGARGCLTFQFFRNTENGDLFMIELNARFGGGFPLTLAAGANYPLWLYEEWVLDQPPSASRDWKDGLTMLRFDDAIFFDGH